MSHKDEPAGDGEHSLSVLLYGWMRGAGFQKRLVIVLMAIGLAAVALEVLLTPKPVRDPGSIPGFQALFGVVAFGGAVLSGWPLGRLLRRREDYYERPDGNTPP
jgi:hypothetical protein